MKKKSSKQDLCEPTNETSVDFCAKMKESCTPTKLLSVAGVAVVGHIIESALKILAKAD